MKYKSVGLHFDIS